MRSLLKGNGYKKSADFTKSVSVTFLLKRMYDVVLKTAAEPIYKHYKLAK